MHHFRPLTNALAFAPIALLMVSASGSAQAATITVNTPADELNSDGDCSLREAIQAATLTRPWTPCAAESGADTVSVPAGTYTLTIDVLGEDSNAGGDLDLLSDMTIIGAGSNSGGIYSFLASLTLNNSSVDNNTSTFDGGGTYSVGGTLTLNTSTVSNNRGRNGAGMKLDNNASAILSDSTISATRR